jgi:uncharacterized membrane protein
MNEHTDEDADGDGESLLESLPAIIAVATLGIGATTAILGLGEVTGIVFVVGWLLLTPLSAILGELSFVQNLVSSSTRERESSNASAGADAEADAALAELKRRYARGDIDEVEFERRTALLLENESLDDVRARVEREHSRTAEGADARPDRTRAPHGTADARHGTADARRDTVDERQDRDRDQEREYET